MYRITSNLILFYIYLYIYIRMCVVLIMSVFTDHTCIDVVVPPSNHHCCYYCVSAIVFISLVSMAMQIIVVWIRSYLLKISSLSTWSANSLTTTVTVEVVHTQSHSTVNQRPFIFTRDCSALHSKALVYLPNIVLIKLLWAVQKCNITKRSET